MSDANTVVETKSGKIEGSYENGLHVFRGVPYAAPPVGELRWLPPQPVEPWDGVRLAKAFGAIAPQNPMPVPPPGMSEEKEPQAEDCLFLNIWTPGLDDARRPVIVWIHGGAFIIGSGSEPVVRGGKLAAHGDIVLVSINYRLGAFGFMNLKEITGGEIPATGNEGLLDQVAALEWVHDNIAVFGGDPGNITVFGFSAGGMSIGILMGMPVARGKFHKALNHSGSTNTVSGLDEAVSISGHYLEVLGLNGGDVKSLRALTTEQLLSAQQELGGRLFMAEHRLTPFQPVVDGEVIPELPIKAIQRGSAKDIIVLAGTALEEWKLMATGEPGLRNLGENGLVSRLSGMMPTKYVPGLIGAYRDALKKRGDALSPADVLAAINTDLMFRIPTIQLVEAQRDNKQLAYNFLFIWKSSALGGVLGACHGMDFRFVFGNYDDSLCGSGPDADKLSRCMQDAWVAFARTGDPSCESIGKWPVYGKNRLTMLLGKDCHLEVAPYEDERRAWDKVNITFTRPI
jgi:para-nitrobenzyl esterase